MVLESYDFLIYSAVTATVFGPLFFPSTDKFTSMLLALGTFGAGFVMRPLGGIFFGHYGDKVGRKPMMIVSLAMIGGSTTLIGFLPTYEQVGIAAPIMLLTLRLVQGFAFGGELGGSILMAIEHAPLHRKGFVGSLPTAAVPLGLVLATLLILLSSTIAGDQYLVWGWRLPFLLASVMFVIGIYVRRFSTETPEFQAAHAERSVRKIPLLEVLRRYPKEVILTTGIYMVNQANFYITVVFIVSYAVGTLHVPFQTMLIATTIASFVQVFALAGFGALSDRVGRIPLMMTAAVGLMIIVFPLFAVIQTKDGVLISIGLTVALIVNAAFFGPLAALYAETFAAEVRYSGISLGANIGSILGGGLTLSVSAALMRHFDGAVWPVCLYVIGITFIGTVCLNFMRRP